MQKPAECPYLTAVDTLAIQPVAPSFIVFRAEIISRQLALINACDGNLTLRWMHPRKIVIPFQGLLRHEAIPPFHGDPLGPFDQSDPVKHPSPPEPRRRTVREIRQHLDR